MARKATSKIAEKELTKGQLRKLNALRKSVGDTIGAKAFRDWMSTQKKEPTVSVDRNAEMIETALGGLVKTKKLRIPRGGYVVRRGRGRVIVERGRKK